MNTAILALLLLCLGQTGVDSYRTEQLETVRFRSAHLFVIVLRLPGLLHAVVAVSLLCGPTR